MVLSRADGRATRWAEHNAQRRADILAAAVALIEEGREVNISEIADRLHVRRPVLYRQFADLAALDAEVFQHGMERLMEVLAPALTTSGTARESIERAISTYLGWIIEHPNLHRYLSTRLEPSGEANRAVAGAKAAVPSLVKQAFARQLAALGAGRVEIADLTANAVVGMVDAAVNRWRARSGPALATEEVSRLLSNAVWAVIDSALGGEGVHLNPDAPLPLP